MRFLAVLLLAASFLFNDIAKINKLKSEAQKSYLQGDYLSALEQYRMLVDSFQVQEEEVLMNYANAAYFLTNPDLSTMKGLEGSHASTAQASGEEIAKYLEIARNQYTQLSLSSNSNHTLRSLSYNQLGVISYQLTDQSKTTEGLQVAKEMFKSALRVDPNNEDARFNYELVSKMLDEQQNQDQDQDQQDQDQQQQNQEQQDQEQQNQEQQNQEQQQSGEDQQQEDQSGEQEPEESEQEEGEPQEGEEQNPQQPQEEEQGEQQPQERPTDPSQMEEMKISEEKAKMILEAMKNAEIQYIQQNQRKATKRPQSGKPDW